MIAVDTSALVAIALDEPQAQACRIALSGEGDLVMSAGTMAEVLIVAHHRGFGDALATLIAQFGIEIVPVTAQTAARIASAHQRWGRGQGTAGLNFGDCFAYELAMTNDCPLLFVGADFAKTDVRCAIQTS